MKKGSIKGFGSNCLILVLVILLVGCSSSKTNVKRKYDKVWNEMVRSQAWKDALLAESAIKPDRNNDFYTNILDATISKEVDYNSSLNEEKSFEEKYHKLVSRAYFKIIAEAESADGRLRKEYELWNSKRRTDKNGDSDLKKQYLQVSKRYVAHQKMLKGLKSWNILSEYGSDDLKFFKNENRNEVHKMLKTNKDEKVVVNFLIYRLADLYHFENQ